MEFWGVEVKAGEPVKVDPLDFDAYIHISQAALGETKKDKGAEPVVLYLKFGDQKLVLGTLSKDNFPQISFDLVLEKEFELSHNSKNVSVFFCGYKAEIPEEEGDDDFDDMSDSEEDVDLPVIAKDNGKLDTKTGLAKVAPSKKSDATFNDTKKQAKVEPKDEEDDEDDDSDEEDDEEGGSDEDVMDADSDSDEESDEDEDDEETPKKQTPKKADLSKKRPNDSASKTPVSAKKAKSGTPEKNDAKKGGHTSTPHPMKKGAKTPNSEAKEPKSGGQLSCKSCSKSFNSESGFQQHNKAKHGGQ
ncbi:hypothetical protein QN277_002937 [Acacia crassicarpa]|uniref:C2H2-type domain-containing protein n=1 Tax=Acacia crassicarpa TaxID=499986 RepID=A0AAE1NBS9_9FABA|nr:hypothetical protein QN277_002937 [Acacia crassicarpa]